MDDDLQEYRRQFTQVDITDAVSLRRWFDRHPSFTNSQHSQIANVTLAKVRTWRELAGFPRGKQRVSKPGRPLPVDTLAPPPGRWRDPAWLIPAYNLTRSLTVIARVARTRQPRVWTALHKLGVPLVGKPPHHCNNREWIEQHYIKQTITLTDCARQAGVNREVFARWVRQHGFQVRTPQQAKMAVKWGQAGAAHIWAQELAYQLDRHPAVNWVRMSDRGLDVKYKHTLLEQYRWDKTHHSLRIFQLDQAGSRYRRDILIHEQYPGAQFDEHPYPHHLIIKPGDWQSASFIEQRIVLHQFMIRTRAHHIPVYPYPAAVLDSNWHKLRKMNPRVFLYDNVLKLSSKGYHYNPAWPLLLHFVELRPELVQLWGKYTHIYKAMCTLLTDTNHKITTENLIRVGCFHYGPKIFNPNVYRCLLLVLGVPRGGVVLDLHPGCGLKAISCALMGLRYRFLSSTRSARFETALQRGLARFLDLDCGPYTGEPVDLVLADNELYEAGVDPGPVLTQYGSIARRIVCRVAHEQHEEYLPCYRPDKLIGIQSKLYAPRYDYLYIW